MYFGSIDYVHALIAKGEVRKAHAFWEYCYRMEFHTPCTSYANNWGVSVSVANKWIQDFYEAINNEIQESKAKSERHTRGLRGGK
jgi:hypothetical protein